MVFQVYGDVCEELIIRMGADLTPRKARTPRCAVISNKVSIQGMRAPFKRLANHTCTLTDTGMQANKQMLAPRLYHIDVYSYVYIYEQTCIHSWMNLCSPFIHRRTCCKRAHMSNCWQSHLHGLLISNQLQVFVHLCCMLHGMCVSPVSTASHRLCFPPFLILHYL